MKRAPLVGLIKISFNGMLIANADKGGNTAGGELIVIDDAELLPEKLFGNEIGIL